MNRGHSQAIYRNSKWKKKKGKDASERKASTIVEGFLFCFPNRLVKMEKVWNGHCLILPMRV